MKRLQLFNGDFHPEDDKLLSVSNRGFCYGDGFFESMRVFNSRFPFSKEHWNRLMRSSRFLGIDIPKEFDQNAFEMATLELVARNGFQNARVRFQGYRMGEGRYTPESNQLGWSMLCQDLEHSEYRLNRVGLKMGVCNTHCINPAPQSSIKSSNSLPYVLGGRFAAANGLDDCFLLDVKGMIAEATGSNVILINGDKLITPDLKFGGVPGVMRTIVLRDATELGYSVKEAPISASDILAADECLLTNAAKGIQWVAAVEKKRYFKKVGTKLIDHINRKYRLIS